MDGSAAAFVEAIDEVGVRAVAAAQIHQGSQADPRR
jgi:UDP-3-O-acyl-N-acetylglucosamine deacetylase